MIRRITTVLSPWISGHFRPLPAGRFEWLVARLAFAWVVWVTFQDTRPFALDSQDSPVGIAHFVPLDFLSHQYARPVILTLVALALACYVIAGRLLAWALLFLTVASTLTNTLLNSQGYILHAYQIVTLTLLGQTVVAFYHRKKNNSGITLPAATTRGHFLYYSQGVVLGTYVVAALAKIFNSYGMWLWNSKYLGIELVKSHRQVYYQKLDPALIDEIGPAIWLQEHPFVAQLIFGGGFFLELLALLGLRSRGWAFCFGVALIIMHRCVYSIMRLEFPYNELLLAIFCLNLPYWIGRLRSGTPTARGSDR